MAFGKREDESVKMTCKSNKKTGEVVCHGTKGENEGTVYGKMDEDGNFRIKDFDGDMQIVHEIEAEMLERTKSIKQSTGM